MAISSKNINGRPDTDASFKFTVRHEIGHNWGGLHDFQFPSLNCESGVMSYDETKVVTILCDFERSASACVFSVNCT